MKMALNSTAFGQRSSFRMRGFFERTVGIAVVSLSHLLVTVGDHTEDGLQTVFRRAQIFPESEGSQPQSQEINFHLAANWRLFHLKVSGVTRLRKKPFTTPMGRWIFRATLLLYFDFISLRISPLTRQFVVVEVVVVVVVVVVVEEGERGWVIQTKQKCIALSKRTKEPAQAKKKEQHLPIRHAGRPADMSSG